MDIFSKQGLLNFVEWLKFLPGDRFKARRRRYLVDEIFKIIQKSVDKHKETLENPPNQDFIFSFMKEQRRRRLSNEDLSGFRGELIVLCHFVRS
jgi:hypothetical protein